ncbi:MAG: M6 family metalloprotease domain-containing protein, partial [Prevotella sp.]|nr:M6 family metalloprotease domain-containing protein [Prevotella sp.]
MKKLFVTLVLTAITMAAVAVPAKRGVWKKLILPDGTEVRAQLVGDEHGHYWKADDGTAYMLKAGNYECIDASQIAVKAKRRAQSVNAKRVKRLQKQIGESSYTGVRKGIILLVNFNDTKFKTSHDSTLFQRIANEVGYSEGKFKGSMRDYFHAQSMGKFELDFDIVGPLTVSRKAEYYGKNDSEGNDQHAGEMVCEAVKLAMNEVSDWKQYDWDGDGYVDQVYVVYAGKGEADSGVENTIWPHAYSLSSAQYYGDGSGEVTVERGLKVDTYACGSELENGTQICGIGTMCHEFSHCL